MKLHMYRFLFWQILLIAVCVFANSPRNAGALKQHLWSAGMPMVYATWNGKKVETFRLDHLFVDVAMAVSLSVFVPTLLSAHKAPVQNKEVRHIDSSASNP